MTSFIIHFTFTEDLVNTIRYAKHCKSVLKIQNPKHPQLPSENPSNPSSPSCLKIRATSQRPSLRLSHEHSHIRHKTAIATLISALLLRKSVSICYLKRSSGGGWKLQSGIIYKSSERFVSQPIFHKCMQFAVASDMAAEAITDLVLFYFYF